MSVTTAFRGGDDELRAGWWVGFDYDAELIARLKAAVPAYDRHWNPERKLWWIAIEHEAALEALMPSFGAFLKQGQLL